MEIPFRLRIMPTTNETAVPTKTEITITLGNLFSSSVHEALKEARDVVQAVALAELEEAF